ncbi:MAG: amino acid permease [Pseudomonadota bacterium]
MPGKAPQGLSMFAGVFTPSILTILGLILFLRLGYVVGEMGVIDTLLIVVIANLISILTTMSLAAIATNMTIRGGGIYYLITRTLGAPFGGTIGIVLFLAQSISVGFYCVGFAEVAAALTGWMPVPAFAALAVLVLFGFAWLGADWATRVQYLIMTCLAVALLSFFVGTLLAFDVDRFADNLGPAPGAIPFWVAFALFFPAVTGFTQGVAMAGDLRDPDRAIPLGTFLAVGVGFLIYLAVPVLLGGTAERSVLQENYNVFGTVSAWPWLIHVGVIAATLSSALASLLGAPRILQSLAKDALFPVLTPFARGEGESNNPRRALLFSGALALVTLALGSLNLIAAVVTMFFLMTYALINYATWYEASAASPSFRPRFRFFDHRVSLLAAVACGACMAVIDLVAGLAAAAVMAALHFLISRRGRRTAWADSQRAYHMQRVREHLFAASTEPTHVRDWRPVLLVFSQDEVRRGPLLKFTTWIEGRSGVATLASIILGEERHVLARRRAVTRDLATAIRDSGAHAFPLVVVANDLDDAVPIVVQSAGVGPLSVNTVLVNLLRVRPTETGTLAGIKFAGYLQEVATLGCNILVLHAEDADWQKLITTPPAERSIDVWWGDDPTSELALLLAFLMTQTDDWQGATIRLLATCAESEVDRRLSDLQAMLVEVRIDARVVIVPLARAETVVRESSTAGLVFLPATIHGGRFYHAFDGEVKDIIDALPVMVMTTAIQPVDLDADPDDTPAA